MNKIINVFAVVFISATTILLSGCAEKSIPVNVQDTLDKYVGFWNTD